MAESLARRWLAIGINRALEVLPMVVMAALAGLTYWLLQINFAPVPRTAQPPQHKPDYTLIDFAVRSFDASGQPRSELLGKRLDHYPDNDTLEVQQPVVRSLSPDAPPAVTTAERGLSNRDGSQVQLFGNVRTVREASARTPRLELRGEFLHLWTREEKLRSHLPVEVIRGNATVRADRIEADNYDRVLQMSGRVRATLPPVR